jgi:hypothetical protein
MEKSLNRKARNTKAPKAREGTPRLRSPDVCRGGRLARSAGILMNESVFSFVRLRVSGY